MGLGMCYTRALLPLLRPISPPPSPFPLPSAAVAHGAPAVHPSNTHPIPTPRQLRAAAKAPPPPPQRCSGAATPHNAPRSLTQSAAGSARPTAPPLSGRRTTSSGSPAWPSRAPRRPDSRSRCAQCRRGGACTAPSENRAGCNRNRGSNRSRIAVAVAVAVAMAVAVAVAVSRRRNRSVTVSCSRNRKPQLQPS